VRVLVTGAAGMLGHRVVEVARERGHDAVGSDLPELDLTDAVAAAGLVADVAPDAVVHCAAYTDVDGAEADERTAHRVNVDATANVGAAARDASAFVVALSTDYVFGGDADRPYVEDDEPAPRTAYGRTKLDGERALDGLGDGRAIARTAWLYGDGGRNFVDTMLALGAQRDEVSVVSDQVGCPTWTGHLAPALLEIAERRLPGIHHAAGGGRCSWYDLAVAVFERAGVDCAVRAVTSEEFVRPAPRPRWSVLGSARADAVRLPPWQDGLAAYLSEKGIA
jgi:dTDP-4-dehydrorhamnose reductase